MNNKAHLRPKDFDSNGDIIPMACKEEKGDLISREALKEHKFVGNKFVQIGGRTNGKTLESINKAYQQGWNDAIDAIINNAPTVAPSVQDLINEYNKGFNNARKTYARPQGDWIPVSDRLPEYSGLYLISIYDLVTVANFTGKHFCDRQMDKFVDVIAWQPLPEPYKKGGAE